MWLTPRRNLSLKDSDFFLFNFFRCFFSIMMAAASAEWPQLFRNLIVWSIHWRSQVILSSCFDGEVLICFKTRVWHNCNHQLEQQQQCHQHQVQHQTKFLSDLAWPHTPYLSTSRILPSYKSYWQATLNGIWWINLSIVSRFCCNLAKLVALCPFWDNVDRSMTKWDLSSSHALCLESMEYMSTKNKTATYWDKYWASLWWLCSYIQDEWLLKS